LMNDPEIQPSDFVSAFIQRFSADVTDRINRMS
jgi:hypothetical protein